MHFPPQYVTGGKDHLKSLEFVTRLLNSLIDLLSIDKLNKL